VPVEWGYDPVTLTIQVQEAGACTTNVCDPRLDCAVTDCPDAPVSLIAGVPDAGDPAFVTSTWNDGPAAGAGAHLNAQPMFHEAAVIVNGVLVQLPWSCGEVRRTRAGPDAAVGGAVVAVVDPPAAVVVVDPPAAVVVVDPPAAVVVVTELPPAAVVVVPALPPAGDPADDALGGGSVWLPELAPLVLVLDAPPPVSPLIHIPNMTATRTAVRSCQVFQDRRSLILSSPGSGGPSDDVNGTRTPSDGDVTDRASVMGPAWSNEVPLHTSRNARAHPSGQDPA